jgi:prepilin-type N-terminal cleavage/methylation domain-containing protein
MSARLRTSRSRRGMTLVELLIAAGIFAVILLVVFRLLQQFLEVWDKAELRRMQVEEASGVAELFAADLDALEPGARGDLLAEWVFFDVNADGTAETKWPRVRFVRHASDAELARMQAGLPPDERIVGEGLIEVIWAVLPAHPGSRDKDLLSLGRVWRGERVYGPARGADVSFFDERYLSSTGVPRPGSTHEVSSGCLWIGMQFATQTSLLENSGWKIGRELGDTVASWDAWARGRPNAERHVWNDPAAFLPEPSDAPLVPRRVRLEFEFERPADAKRRTKLSAYCGQQEGALEAEDGRKLPDLGAFVLIDAEWMQVTGVIGDSFTVKRGQRGTPAAAHEAGAFVHFGRTTVREAPIATHREDWDL